MQPISRRTCLQRLALTLSATAIPTAARSEEIIAPTDAEKEIISKIAREFMEKHEAPGLSVSFSYRDQVSYSIGFGMADVEKKDEMTPRHLFRIASIAKPLTAVGIYKLIEQGKLKPEDHIFGDGGLLQVRGLKKLPEGVEDITLHHLLTHTCGGWQNDGNDPMFRHPDLDHRELIATTLREQPLKNAPGSSYAYSNFGYCLLGRVIEKSSGKSYATFMEDTILKPSGVKDMKISGNTREDRAKDEVIYYGQNGEDPYHMNVRRMDSHGGWLATPEDIVRVFNHCSGAGAASTLLRADTVKSMLTASNANPGYASGWAVNEARHRWHSGSLPGTSTIAVRTSGGMCWAGFANARNKDIALALDQMMWQMAKAVPAWQA
ncbi:serine hydrolase domain-containing protein [Luteolibacter luteus]|uniref:Beta-lactamase family protein n=1 Tax=Luteolibacter luteus TaxID=2728835 RepID=A0A858RPE1_9BACT|nr:serine hydrolase domain-containing protein [Luteolibacter luteus]QJE98219.1 beta-lactamase family protein [Luteolibacter luteus]